MFKSILDYFVIYFFNNLLFFTSNCLNIFLFTEISHRQFYKIELDLELISYNGIRVILKLMLAIICLTYQTTCYRIVIGSSINI